MASLPPPTVPPGCPNTLNDPTVKIVIINRIYGTAMFTVMIWDWLVTFQQEYKLIWKAPWSPVKIVFLVQRYWSLIFFAVPMALYDGNWSGEVCNKVYKLDPIFSIPMLLCGNIILIIRAYAIWERNKIILGICLASLAGGLATMIVAVSTMIPIPVPGGMEAFACIAAGKPGGGKMAAGFFLAPLAVDLVVTALTSIKVLMYYRRGTSSSILMLFWRDGIFYYILISAANLLNGVFFLQDNQSIQAINAIFAICLSSVLSLRLLLHLRSVTTSENGASLSNSNRNQSSGIEMSGKKLNHAHIRSGNGNTSGQIGGYPRPMGGGGYNDDKMGLQSQNGVPQSQPYHGGIKVNVSTAQTQDYDEFQKQDPRSGFV